MYKKYYVNPSYPLNFNNGNDENYVFYSNNTFDMPLDEKKTPLDLYREHFIKEVNQ